MEVHEANSNKNVLEVVWHSSSFYSCWPRAELVYFLYHSSNTISSFRNEVATQKCFVNFLLSENTRAFYIS